MKILGNPLIVLAVLFAGLSLFSVLAGIWAIKGKSRLGGTIGVLLGLFFLSLALFLATLSISTAGYRAMIHEETAAVVKIEPDGPQRFWAMFRFPDGREERFHLEGDELYVDAHILKWKPIVNIFGVHTAYELDRVAGRYSRLEDERSRPRTVYSLGREKPLDLFALRRRFAFLKPLLDAEYGSATFVPAKKSIELEIRVSTTGLLIRPLEERRRTLISRPAPSG